MTAWFTSDLHLGHSNIIEYCRRPFLTKDEMNGVLIARWNSVVQPWDVVYVIGDFAMTGSAPLIDGWLYQLSGAKILIRGNHDNKRVLKKVKGWVAIHEMLDLDFNEARVRMCHYRLLDWRGPSIQLHGHSHSNAPVTSQHTYDVGVDPNDYRPISLSHIVSTIRAAYPEE